VERLRTEPDVNDTPRTTAQPTTHRPDPRERTASSVWVTRRAWQAEQLVIEPTVSPRVPAETVSWIVA